MGGKVSSEKTLIRAKAKGYSYKAHREEDRKSNNSPHIGIMIKDQEFVSRRYEMYEYPFDCVKSSD